MKQVFAIFLTLSVAFSMNSCSMVKGLDNPLELLTKNQWVLSTLLGNVIGKSDFGQQLPFLNFGDDGSINGSTGCNNFNGQFNLSGTSLSLDPGAMTKKACPGEGESNFLSALNSVKNFKIDGNTLKLLDGAKEVMSFIKK